MAVWLGWFLKARAGHGEANGASWLCTICTLSKVNLSLSIPLLGIEAISSELMLHFHANQTTLNCFWILRHLLGFLLCFLSKYLETLLFPVNAMIQELWSMLKRE